MSQAEEPTSWIPNIDYPDWVSHPVLGWMVVVALGWIIAPRIIRAAARFIRTAWNFTQLRVPVPGQRNGNDLIYAPLQREWEGSIFRAVRTWIFVEGSRRVYYAGFAGMYRSEMSKIRRTYLALIKLRRENRRLDARYGQSLGTIGQLIQTTLVAQRDKLNGTLRQYNDLLRGGQRDLSQEGQRAFESYVKHGEFLLNKWRNEPTRLAHADAVFSEHCEILNEAIRDLKALRKTLLKNRRRLTFKVQGE